MERKNITAADLKVGDRVTDCSYGMGKVLELRELAAGRFVRLLCRPDSPQQFETQGVLRYDEAVEIEEGDE